MELPVVDLSRYLQSSNSESDPQLGTDLLDSCREVSRILKETGALLVKDPRCSAEDNDRFIDMMETYFSKPDEFKRLQERPNLHYQVPPLDLHFLTDNLFYYNKTTVMLCCLVWTKANFYKNSRFDSIFVKKSTPFNWIGWCDAGRSWGSEKLGWWRDAREIQDDA